MFLLIQAKDFWSTLSVPFNTVQFSKRYSKPYIFVLIIILKEKRKKKGQNIKSLSFVIHANRLLLITWQENGK